MPVENISIRNNIAGWLLGFEIDSHILLQDHKNWLDTNVLLPMSLDSIRAGILGNGDSGTSWKIWVIGTASRTGSYRYNQALSRRRAEAARHYLASKLAASSPVWSIETLPLSELPATLLGRKDEVENLLDRAVLVVAQRIGPNKRPQTPVVQPPPHKVSVDFYLYANRGAFMNATKWQAELYAVYRHKGEVHYDGWTGSSSGFTVSPGDINKAWTPPLPSTDRIFAGPAETTFPAAGALDRLNGKAITVGARGSDMILRIVNAGPNGGDLNLRLPLVTATFELSQTFGGLNRRRPLDEAARRTLKNALWAKAGALA